MAKRSPFVVAELGADINPFVLHLFAAVAEWERVMISERTRGIGASQGERGEAALLLTPQWPAPVHPWSTTRSAVNLCVKRRIN